MDSNISAPCLFRFNSQCVLHVSGPDFWPLQYPACSEARQSPVQIMHTEAEPLSSLSNFRFHGYEDTNTLNNLTVWNDGYTGTRTSGYVGS